MLNPTGFPIQPNRFSPFFLKGGEDRISAANLKAWQEAQRGEAFAGENFWSCGGLGFFCFPPKKGVHRNGLLNM